MREFALQVDVGSVSETAGLLAGQRIVEVNGESLLGATQGEAAALLRAPHQLRLLVCHGYNIPAGGASALASAVGNGRPVHHRSHTLIS